MRIKPLFIAGLAVAAVAGLAALVVAIRGLEAGNEDAVRAEFRSLERLDARFNEEVARARLIVDVQRDVLYELLDEVAARMDDLVADAGPLAGIAPAMDTARADYIAAMREKVELGREYERRNLRLVNALALIPSVSDELLAQLPVTDEYDPAIDFVNRFNKEILAYGMLPNPTNIEAVEDMLYRVSQSDIALPDGAGTPFRRLASLGNAVLGDKQVVQTSLEKLLAFPTSERLGAIQSAYADARGARLAAAQQYRWALLAYAGLLLLGLAWLGWRLRASYRSLDTANDALRDANVELEQRVARRTEHLEQAMADLKSSQAQLVQSEKMASLGQMVAGVSHEINTPLGYVRSNNEIVSTSMQEVAMLLGSYRDALALLDNPAADFEATARALQELEQLKAELEPDTLLEELQQLVADNHHGLAQIGELVANLKDFSRLDRSRTEFVNLNDGLDAALNICQGQLKHRIEVVRDYGELPEIECAPSQVNQVFLNLITNAGQAMGDAGRLTLITRHEADRVLVRIRDTGAGMDEATRAQIFDPFFTTKPLGEGTGLGLAIVYRIVNEHGGRIVAASVPGRGTEFTVMLPLRQAQAPETAETVGMAEEMSA